ncbi:uncharacterized protein LOC112190549 [Rosa chinensis]|uniref:uncharacterized protein LOC112190549 n=1 Tax=Rosa chinensis TaxID=74649 RepID=UPI001AD925B1|nr:uncharacterized protein LOC112190549 [Rosa chinensis]
MTPPKRNEEKPILLSRASVPFPHIKPKPPQVASISTFTLASAAPKKPPSRRDAAPKIPKSPRSPELQISLLSLSEHHGRLSSESAEIGLISGSLKGMVFGIALMACWGNGYGWLLLLLHCFVVLRFELLCEMVFYDSFTNHLKGVGGLNLVVLRIKRPLPSWWL